MRFIYLCGIEFGIKNNDIVLVLVPTTTLLVL